MRGEVGASPNFANRTLWTRDNLDILRGLNSATVDLIYLDPPFNSNKQYAAPVGSKAAGAAFKDTWHLSDLDVAWMGLIADEQPAIAYLLDAAGQIHSKGMQSYLTMMAVRLLEMRRVLKDTGSIYLHCDPTASHYLKLLMDAVFGQGSLRNEIIWHYRTSSGRPRDHFIKNSDTLLFYSKVPRHNTFNWQKEPWPASTLKKWQSDRKGIYRTNNGKKYYIDPDGKLIDNVWEITLSSRSRERMGYPTQKPLALLERVIAASSNEGDIVLDPFCGCATACVVSERLGRQWVGIDISPKAAELIQVRLKQEEPGIALWASQVVSRSDIPHRTDIDAPKNYRQNKHVLYGSQEGHCNGCKMDFPYKIMEVDHVIPQSKGGTDHLGNLQLLCGHCNKVKGDKPMEHLVAELATVGH